MVNFLRRIASRHQERHIEYKRVGPHGNLGDQAQNKRKTGYWRSAETGTRNKGNAGGAKDDSGQEQSIAPDVSVNRHDCKPPNCHCLYFNCYLTIFQSIIKIFLVKITASDPGENGSIQQNSYF